MSEPVRPPTFFLGTHKPHWLRFANVPLFVSARRLRELKALPRAMCPWALDSGGFTELTLYESWRTTPEQYAEEAATWQSAVGSLLFASPQDWMCEPIMLGKTKQLVQDHQRLTITSYLRLRELAPSVPWIPVLQGWKRDDYLRHVRDYQRHGVSLDAVPLVGLGSICRRQATRFAEELVRELCDMGIRLHAFGLKLGGLLRAAKWLASSDSMAWSLDARRSEPLPGHAHRSCSNCLVYAMEWREKAVRAISRAMGRPTQRGLWEVV